MSQATCPKCKTLLTGRHCLTGCGYTRPLSQEERVRVGELKPHKKLEPECGQALVDLMAEFKFTLPPRTAAQWRVVRDRPTGWLTAPNVPVTLLATDGIVCWCVRGDGTSLMYAHLANFVANEEQSAALPKARLKRQPSRRQQLLDSI